jgi:hypothetical protein
VLFEVGGFFVFGFDWRESSDSFDVRLVIGLEVLIGGGGTDLLA